MDLSVIIPTYNRSDSLLKTLDCLKRQRVSPSLRWEVIVVDNNCTDGTGGVVTHLADDFPVPLRHVIELNQGASNARNRGIAAACGAILLFTDDDVRPDPDWIAAVSSTFSRYGCHGVVGRIELQWTFGRPRWVTDDLTGFLARLDYGDSETAIVSDETPPYGPNMAFRKSVFETIAGFNPNLGRNGGSLATGEEPELFARFIAAGFTAVYQPASVVYHELQSTRVKKSFFRKSHFYNGVYAGGRYDSSKYKRLLGIPLFIFPQFCRSVGVFLKDSYRSGLEKSLRQEVNAWYFLGFMVGCAKNCLGRR